VTAAGPASPAAGRRRSGRIVVAAFLVAALPAADSTLPSAAEEIPPLNLFQRVARAGLVVHVRVHEGALRFALVDVLEVLKGSAPAERLRIAFRDFNFSRPRDTDPIVFPDGQEEILFLVPYNQVPRSEKKKEKYRDLFDLLQGPQGRITVPAEGAGAIFDAVRRLVQVAGQDPASQVEGLRGLLVSENPLLPEAGLEELARLRAATPVLYPRLIHLLQSPSPGLRVRSLALVGQIFSSRPSVPESVSAEEALDEAGQALAAVLERARNDPDAGVRVQAVQALAAWPAPPDVEADLRAIASQDASQEVRFEAERALFRAGARR